MKKYTIMTAIVLLACVMLTFASCEEVENVEGVKMVALIKSIGDKIEVEVVDGEYGASGIYWVNVGSDTVYLDKNGNRTIKAMLKVGDTVEITYGGQVMMSYPPQIVALQIQIK